MFRCVNLPLMALAATAAMLATPAVAQTSRPFPADALRGSLVITQPPEALINGRSMRLSPGARIRGTDNMLMMSGGLVGLKILVHYTLDPLGLVHNVWVLNEEEASRKPWPTTPEQAQTWSFDPAAQTWTRR